MGLTYEKVDISSLSCSRTAVEIVVSTVTGIVVVPDLQLSPFQRHRISVICDLINTRSLSILFIA